MQALPPAPGDATFGTDPFTSDSDSTDAPVGATSSASSGAGSTPTFAQRRSASAAAGSADSADSAAEWTAGNGAAAVDPAVAAAATDRVAASLRADDATFSGDKGGEANDSAAQAFSSGDAPSTPWRAEGGKSDGAKSENGGAAPPPQTHVTLLDTDGSKLLSLDDGAVSPTATAATAAGDAAAAAFAAEAARDATATSSATGAADSAAASDATAEEEPQKKRKKKSSGSMQTGAQLAAVYTAKLICYFVMQGAAMRLPVADLAAHNAMFSLWNVCAYFPMPLQTTALTFVPRCSTKEVRLPRLHLECCKSTSISTRYCLAHAVSFCRTFALAAYSSAHASQLLISSNERNAGVQGRAHVAQLILKGALLIALPLVLFCVAVPTKLSALITSDVHVSNSLVKLAPLAACSILLCTIDVACEGLLVAQRRMRLLITSMTVVLSLVGVYFFCGGGKSLAGTWGGLVVFFGPRWLRECDRRRARDDQGAPRRRAEAPAGHRAARRRGGHRCRRSRKQQQRRRRRRWRRRCARRCVVLPAAKQAMLVAVHRRARSSPCVQHTQRCLEGQLGSGQGQLCRQRPLRPRRGNCSRGWRCHT